MDSIVIDCNILISAGLTNGVCRQAIFKAIEDCKIIISTPILDEYIRVANRPKFEKSTENIFSIIRMIENKSEYIRNIIVPGINIPDPNDLIYLYAAINANAKYIVTGNIKDFPQLKYHGVEIVTPTIFLHQ